MKQVPIESSHSSMDGATKKWVRWIFWVGVTLLSMLSWATVVQNGDVWPVLLRTNHRNILYVCIGMLLVPLLFAVRLGLLLGLKLIASSSAIAGLLALLRGLLIGYLNRDCVTLCLGLLNSYLGLGCGSADEGCADEFFFLSFLGILLLGTVWASAKNRGWK